MSTVVAQHAVAAPQRRPTCVTFPTLNAASQSLIWVYINVLLSASPSVAPSHRGRMTALRSALAFALLAFCSAEASRTQDSLRALPCPAPEDILPCVCTVYEDHGMDMDCSAVADEEELARVFSAHLPFTDFRNLLIRNNDGVKTLRFGDLGPATFQEIIITDGSLEDFQSGAVSQSNTTLKYLHLFNNELSSFPFQDLPLFTSCTKLYLHDNYLSDLPRLESESLQFLHLSENLIQEIPVDTFQGLISLQDVVLYSNNISEIIPGTFSHLVDIRYIDVQSNHLTHIPNGAFEVTGNNLEELYLNGNDISSIDVGGLPGFVDYLYLYDNSLTILAEEVFKPVFKTGSNFYLSDNPLECGCDLAWLVTNPTFMGQLMGNASCYDGELLSDLDPGIYEDLC